MKRLSLYFTGPCRVEMREEPLPDPGEGQVQVDTLWTAISPGTELLVYRGQFPMDLALDENIAALADKFEYPLKYGYSLVGRVTRTGAGVAAGWEGRLVFAFHPHESAFLAQPEELIPVPDGITPEQAVFLPNLETAVNFVMDGAPRLGERVLVVGQGIVGLLTTALLARFPLASLITLDRYPLRRQASLGLGAQASLDPDQVGDEDLRRALVTAPAGVDYWDGADLSFELSGAPQAVDRAIAATGFGGRVVIGSWYGAKKVNLDLGGRFHRSRMQLISSQVSSLAPELSARWTKQRRFDLVWSLLPQVDPTRLITQRYHLAHAAEAFELIHQNPTTTIQVLLDASTQSL